MLASAPRQPGIQPEPRGRYDGRQSADESLPAAETSAPMQQRPAAAVTAFWAHHDQACNGLNREPAHTGSTDRVIGRWTGDERRYCLVRPATRFAAVSGYFALPASDGHVFGGASVQTMRRANANYLLPAGDFGEPGWLITAAGSECTREDVLDVWASVFLEDSDAEHRAEQGRA